MWDWLHAPRMTRWRAAAWRRHIPWKICPFRQRCCNLRAPCWLSRRVLRSTVPGSGTGDERRAGFSVTAWPTVPHLSGIFLNLNDATAAWTKAQWVTDFRSMQAVGIRFFCLHHPITGINDTLPGCPYGRYAGASRPWLCQPPATGKWGGRHSCSLCLMRSRRSQSVHASRPRVHEEPDVRASSGLLDIRKAAARGGQRHLAIIPERSAA